MLPALRVGKYALVVSTGLTVSFALDAQDKPVSVVPAIQITDAASRKAPSQDILQVQAGQVPSNEATQFDPLAALTEAGLPPASAQGQATSPPSTTATGPQPNTGSVSNVGTSDGQATGVYNASDIGELLTKSANATGVDIQQRNGIMSDPRVRGYRVGQLVTIGDGAFYFPARQDLDTAVAKFDPASVQNVGIFRGPYTSMLGPGFAFFDVSSLDSPRYNCGFETHGRTSLRYQTNGNRWDALQTILMGDSDWGMRLTYNYLNGTDYQAGNGMDISGNYLSNNVSGSLGFDLTPDSSLEFKFLRVHQSNLDFPGLYFDIRTLDTEAYTLRYTLNNQRQFDKFTLDLWYNSTNAVSDTINAPKQAFVRKLLGASFNPDQVNNDNVASFPESQFFNRFEDFSTSNFSNKSLGYRGAIWWGGGRNQPTLVAGSDLNILGQNLVENIRLRQTNGTDQNTGEPIIPPNSVDYFQTQTIPDASLVNPGLFVEASLPIGDMLALRAGGRIDYVSTSSGSRLIYGDINLAGPGTQVTPGTNPNEFSLDPDQYSVDPNNHINGRNFFLYSGFLSGDWKIDDNTVLTAGYAHAMRAPTLTELYASGPFVGMLQQGTNRLIGDANLEPETLDQIDLSLKVTGDWYRGSISGYYAFIRNYITFDQNISSPGINQIIFTNTDLATLAGGEVYGQVELTRMISVFQSASYVQGTDMTHRDNRRPANLASSRRNNPVTQEYAVATEALPQIPPFELRYGFRIHESVNINQQSPRWSVEFSGRSVMDQDYVAYSLNEFTTPGFTVFDIRGYWMIKDGVLVTAGVENLTNTFYREHLDPISGNLLGVNPFYRTGINYYMGCQLTY